MADKIRVIAFKEGDVWIAQCLEHDICVQANSLDDLYGRVDVAVRLESEDDGGLDRIGEAPKYFFDLWDKKAGAYKPDLTGNCSYDFGLAA